MRAVELWGPTKYVRNDGQWRANRDRQVVTPASRLIADLTASAYARTLRDYARGDLLDLGCGYVPLFDMYRNYVDSITCADWANSMHRSIHLDLELDLNEPLPFREGSFDTVVMTDVLEHLRNPDDLFPELRRILRPGGRLILGVPFFYWIHEQPHDFHRYTSYKLELLCAQNGLDVLQCKPYGRDSDVLLDVVAKLMAMNRYLKWASNAPALLRRRSSPREGEAAMPLGYVLVAGA